MERGYNCLGDMGKMKKLGFILLFCTSGAYANTYLEFKNELPFRDTTSQDQTNHLRLGYKFDNSFYIEAGRMTHGSSMEMGYKFKKNGWTIKGKFEGQDSSKRDYFKSKIQTEIRYTFGD